MSQRRRRTVQQQWGRGKPYECIGCLAWTRLSWRSLCVGCELEITRPPRTRPRARKTPVELEQLLAALRSRTDDRSSWPADLLRAALAARERGVNDPLIAEASREYKRRHEHNRRHSY